MTNISTTDTQLGVITISGLIWSDKHQWTGIAATEGRAADGANVIQLGVMKKGRPITLSGRNTTWLTESELHDLQALAATGQPFQLTRGTYRAEVMFRYSEQVVIETEQFFERADTESEEGKSTLYRILTIKLIEV